MNNLFKFATETILNLITGQQLLVFIRLFWENIRLTCISNTHNTIDYQIACLYGPHSIRKSCNYCTTISLNPLLQLF